MLNFVLCDDNVKVLDKLSIMLENIFIKNDLDAKIAFKSTHEDELLNFTMSNTIDVLILDIDLKSKNNGIDLANTIREYNKDCYIIFITAHSEYVFLAYKCKTFDYICKPITKQRLQEAILRLFPVFLIVIPCVAEIGAVSAIVKLPFLFCISTVPSEVLIFDVILALAPSVVILMFPLVFAILPFTEVVPLETAMVVLPRLFIIAAF